MPRKRAKPSEILAASKVEAKHFDLSELAHEFVSAMGGTRPFVKQYVQEYHASRAGTVAKYKLLSGMMAIVVRAAEKSKPQTETGNLSDEELHQTLLAELKRRGIVVEETNEQSDVAAGADPVPASLPGGPGPGTDLPAVPGEPGTGEPATDQSAGDLA